MSIVGLKIETFQQWLGVIAFFVAPVFAAGGLYVKMQNVDDNVTKLSIKLDHYIEVSDARNLDQDKRISAFEAREHR